MNQQLITLLNANKLKYNSIILTIFLLINGVNCESYFERVGYAGVVSVFVTLLSFVIILSAFFVLQYKLIPKIRNKFINNQVNNDVQLEITDNEDVESNKRINTKLNVVKENIFPSVQRVSIDQKLPSPPPFTKFNDNIKVWQNQISPSDVKRLQHGPEVEEDTFDEISSTSSSEDDSLDYTSSDSGLGSSPSISTIESNKQEECKSNNLIESKDEIRKLEKIDLEKEEQIETQVFPLKTESEEIEEKENINQLDTVEVTPGELISPRKIDNDLGTETNSLLNSFENSSTNIEFSPEDYNSQSSVEKQYERRSISQQERSLNPSELSEPFSTYSASDQELSQYIPKVYSKDFTILDESSIELNK